MLKIGLCGASGRMGQEIKKVIGLYGDKYILAASTSRESQIADLLYLCKNVDVVIDFSVPGNIAPLLESALATGRSVLIGTTGLEVKELQAIYEAAEKIAVLYAPNTSLGANLLAAVAAKLSRILPEYDIEIIETHHKHKKDSPSGTALEIGKQIAAARNVSFAEKAVFGRSGQALRALGEIGFSSIRGGGVFGEHEVIFAGPNETLHFEHRALNREAFAEGALVAAAFIANKAPGLYSMRDIFDLSRLGEGNLL